MNKLKIIQKVWRGGGDGDGGTKKKKDAKENKLTIIQSFIYPTDAHLDCSYLLTTWSRVLLEKLTGLQLVKKFPTFCGKRRFITALTSARHLSLS
jgi:hypothetical protein